MREIQDIELTEKLIKILHAAQRSISKEFNVDRIVLFGSVARGQSDEESDVDILLRKNKG